MIHLIAVAFTEQQNDRIIDLIFKIVQGVGYVVTMVLPVLILRYQKRNVTAIKTEVEKSTVASEVALTVANGHNAKIADLTQQILELQSKIKK